MKRNRNRSRLAVISPALQVVEQLESRRLLSAPIMVTNTNDSGAGSLRDAITAAQPGDTVDLSGVSGTFESFSSYNISTDLTITGPGAGALTVDGDGFGSVFKITGGTVAISGLTITQQDAGGEVGLSQGGGIYNSATLTLNNVAIKNCTVTGLDNAQGGGIYNSGTLAMTDCTISGNKANVAEGMDFVEAYGGGIYSSGALTLSNCTISGNSATGSISTTSFDPFVEVWGGGVYLTGSGGTSFTNCTLAGNAVSGTVSGESDMGIVESLGAGIFDTSSGTLNLTNCTVAGNTATATNLSGSAQTNGGGIYDYSGDHGTITNCIIAQNTASSQTDLDNQYYTSGGHNIIGQLASVGSFNAAGDQVGTSDMPIDPKLGELADNGGSTQTLALLSGSPAINAGDDAKAPATDQRGFDRVGVSDIGAFEFGASDNQAPAFVDGPTSKRIVTGNAFSWTISATDPDNDALTFSAKTALPSWITLTNNNDGTATLSGTPANADMGQIDLSLSVSDGKASADLALTLNAVLPRWQLDSNGLLTVAGESRADDIHIWRHGSQIRMIRNGIMKNFPAFSVNQIEVYGLDGDDFITVNSRRTPAYACGGAGNDTLIGSAEDDILTGGGGNDQLYAGGGSNRLNGSTGNDRLFAGSGENRLFGDEGADTLVGGAGQHRTDNDPLDQLLNMTV